MKLEFVANPKWYDAEQTSILCDAKFEEKTETIPVVASETNFLSYLDDVWAEAIQQTIDPFVEETVNLDDAKDDAKYNIDNRAGIVRDKFITNSSGQEMTYQEKAKQAEAFVAASYPADTTGYAFIQAEMDAFSKTKEQAADDILTQRDAWLVVGSAIEKHRLSGKKQVDDASTTEEINTIVQNTIALLDAV